MTPSQLYDLFRSQISDDKKPYLISDTEVFEYMTDAQRMLCRLTDGIPDSSTPEIVELTFVAGDEFADFSPLIRTVRGAYRNSDQNEISVLNIEDFRFGTGAWFIERDNLDYGMLYAPALSGRVDWRRQTGTRIEAIILGMEKNKARCYPVLSDGDEVVYLNVFRLPLCDITDKSKELEVDDEHHRHLLLWMFHLAYMKNDVDIRDDAKAKSYEQQFMGYCDFVKREQGRRRHKPRTVMYGGI